MDLFPIGGDLKMTKEEIDKELMESIGMTKAQFDAHSIAQDLKYPKLNWHCYHCNSLIVEKEEYYFYLFCLLRDSDSTLYNHYTLYNSKLSRSSKHAFHNKRTYPGSIIVCKNCIKHYNTKIKEVKLGIYISDKQCEMALMKKLRGS